MNSRRRFLIRAPLGLLSVAVACRERTATPSPNASGQTPGAPPATPGAPPTFASAPSVGPAVTPATFADAEKLAQVTMTDAQRQQAADSWGKAMAPYYERRTGPRKLALEATLAPATRWNPVLGAGPVGPVRDRFVRSSDAPGPLPSSDAEIAFAPVTRLSRWIQSRALTSERLTNI